MTALDKAVDIICKYEGFSPKPYYATAHEKEIGKLTIGFGTTLLNSQPVKATDKLTETEARIILIHSIADLESSLRKICPKSATENQIAACISFVYNIGLQAFKDSTLLKMWLAGDMTANVAEQFMRWTKQAGKELGGLVKRRASERNLFLTV